VTRLQGAGGRLRGGKANQPSQAQPPAKPKTLRVKPGKSEKQRAAALMKMHRAEIVKYEVNSAMAKLAKRPTKQQRQKLEKNIMNTVNKLTDSAKIKIAKKYVEKTREKRMKDSTNDAARRRVSRQVSVSNAAMRRRTEKLQAFENNADRIYADKSKPLNVRKLANAVRKGILFGSPKGKAGASYRKTSKADPLNYERERAAKSMMVQSRRRAVSREQARQATPEMGRRLTKTANKKPFARKTRVPKAKLITAPRVRATVQARAINVGLNAYEKNLNASARVRARRMARIKPIKERERTNLRRPATPSN
jgi:hypothetical protein